jgi:hypothetical protein
MSDSTEAAWREALEKRGRAWVTAKLQERPGRPDEIVYDVVFQAPYPTRSFCEFWCAAEDNKVLHFSGYSKAVLITSIVLFAFIAKAAISWNSMPPPQKQNYVHSGNAGDSHGFDYIGSPLDPVDTAKPALAASSGQSTLCSYINYQTDRCGNGLSGGGATGSSGGTKR